MGQPLRAPDLRAAEGALSSLPRDRKHKGSSTAPDDWGFLTPLDVEPADLERAAELVETYADLPLGGTDACVVALAEWLDVAEVATIDRRHFSIVRPRHVEAFTIVPEGGRRAKRRAGSPRQVVLGSLTNSSGSRSRAAEGQAAPDEDNGENEQDERERSPAEALPGAG